MVTVHEWAPLWAVPVIPAPSRRSCRSAIAAAFPGEISRFSVRFNSTLGVAILIPELPGAPWESTLPVPILALARFTTASERKNQIFHFPTATGFDCYRCVDGMLQEIWTAQTPPETSQELLVPGTSAHRCIPSPAHSQFRKQLSSSFGVVLPLCLVLAGIFLPLPSTADPHLTPEKVEREEVAAIHHTVNLTRTFSVMKQLSDALPDVHLDTLRINHRQSELSFRTSQPVTAVILALTHLEQSGKPISWTVHREENQSTAIQMEVNHE